MTSCVMENLKTLSITEWSDQMLILGLIEIIIKYSFSTKKSDSMSIPASNICKLHAATQQADGCG